MRVAIYTRLSTADALSVAEQEQLCRERYEREGCSVVEVYCDRAKSARKDDLNNRPAMRRLLADAKAGRFEAVVCIGADRVIDFLPEDVLAGFEDALAELVLAVMEDEGQGEVPEARSEPEKRSRRRRAEGTEQEA